MLATMASLKHGFRAQDEPLQDDDTFDDMKGYNSAVDSIREHEFPMLKDITYLDHAGITLCPKSLVESFSRDMMSNVYGNPASASSSSQLSARRIEDIRLRVLRYFNADPDHFDLIFVANATAGIKVVMEAFREHGHGFWYGYHKDSHTSLVGLREAARAGQHCFTSDEEVEEWLDEQDEVGEAGTEVPLRLFAYPGQSNMNGRRLPLAWTQRLRSSKRGRYVYSLLDAASLVSTSPLDLSHPSTAPDFTVLSFYKIFGFPDLGALIVRKEIEGLFQRRDYFGGGTVEMVTCGKENWHIRKRGSLHEQLEDGTLPVHSIIALDNALDVHRRLFGSLQDVAAHTAFLSERLYRQLSALRHDRGNQICDIYTSPTSDYGNSYTQGPILAFNFKNNHGEFVSNAEVEKLAAIRNIQLRSGGLCNPGGVASSLGLAAWEMMRNFSAGHRCGNENDIIGGKPTGMLRVSFGALSNLRDVQTFVKFAEEFFVEKRPEKVPAQPPRTDFSDFHVESLTIYPIKSCGGWRIPCEVEWDVRQEGLAWDREWCLVHQGTRKALSQKTYPKMALLRPSIDLKAGLLRVRQQVLSCASLPNEVTVPLSGDPTVYEELNYDTGTPNSQVCGDDTHLLRYVSKTVAEFFSTTVGTPCTLARFPPNTTGLSARHSKPDSAPLGAYDIPRPILLSNESPILVISRSSLNWLNEQIKLRDGKAAHASVFRANIIVAEDSATSPGQERPYVEDDWDCLKIGSQTMLDVLGACRRCQMVCIDQGTAEKNGEPYLTLAKTRRKQGKVFFGVHTALAYGKGMGNQIRVNDRVIPLTGTRAISELK
ncbi:MAG: hypothetical protein Q9163_005331 [Psora crenata]